MGPRRGGLLCYRKGLCWERRGRAHRQRPPPAFRAGVWAATAAPHRTAPHRACMHASSSPGLCSPCNPLSRSLALPWGSERDKFAANLPILRTAAAPALAPAAPLRSAETRVLQGDREKSAKQKRTNDCAKAAIADKHHGEEEQR
jgi:hypothetical protein